jgi:hypothetical protein
MNSHTDCSPSENHEAGQSEPPRVHAATRQSERRQFRLSPVGAISIAVAILTLGYWRASDPDPARLGEPPACSPAEAVDISLQRLVRSRVVRRLQREHRLSDLPIKNRAIIDDEIDRIHEHPIYVMIKERMTDHLRNEGYDSVVLIRMQDPKDYMLSMDADASLHAFIHSLRASFPAPNEKVAIFLRNHEEVFGTSIVARGPADRYDAAVTLLIQLLFEYPDDLKPVAGAVRILAGTTQEIERGRTRTER